jgi:hypothetical protein
LRGNEQEAHHASRSAKGSDRDSLKELEEPPPHPEAKTERNWGREDGGKATDLLVSPRQTVQQFLTSYLRLLTDLRGAVIKRY